MLPNLKNVDNCEVIIYLSGSYKKKIVFLYDIHLKLIEFTCVMISFLLFSNLLHHWIITWMLLILFLGFTFNLLWIQKCIDSLKTRESISLKGAPKNINNALLHLFHQCASFHWCVYYSCQPFMLKLELIMGLYFHTTLWLMHFCCNAWMIKDTR